MTIAIDDRTEWLEADGLGGFASGTTSGIRTRRYHALLLAATTPPTGRIVLVNGFDAFIETAAGTFPLTSQQYLPEVTHPDGASRIVQFLNEPWPVWDFEFPDGTRVTQELCVRHGGATLMTWTLAAGTSAALRLRPFLSGRDYHSLHHENASFRFDADVDEAAVTFRPYDGLPAATFFSNGAYRHAPEWYRQFLYRAERARGLDDTEALASPGEFSWTLPGPGATAVLILSAGPSKPIERPAADDVVRFAARIKTDERRRRAGFSSPLDRAADAYLVRRGNGRTIVAGYPWFTDWGRDTFIAVRGLCLATGRIADARDILVEWADAVSEGMLPNRFPDRGEAPEFNSVDASLWYVVAVHGLIANVRAQSARAPKMLTSAQERALQNAVLNIVSGYAAGTRYGIRMDGDGLLMAGVPGVQLTWMDARVGDRVITPRVGKPVEIQALWVNALSIASAIDPRWTEPLARARAAFEERFWNEALGRLADVIDVDGVAGSRDDTLRPNQILAVGGLPFALVDGARARRIVDAVEAELLTPLGLRSLGPREAPYAGRYDGGPSERDAVYHQGTAWPWLLGPFIEAWVTVRGNTKTARAEASRRLLAPLRRHLDEAGLGHVSEITDADAPYAPKGCPFQAWSLGELLRLERDVLRDQRLRPLRAARPRRREAAAAR